MKKFRISFYYTPVERARASSFAMNSRSSLSNFPRSPCTTSSRAKQSKQPSTSTTRASTKVPSHTFRTLTTPTSSSVVQSTSLKVCGHSSAKQTSPKPTSIRRVFSRVKNKPNPPRQRRGGCWVTFFTSLYPTPHSSPHLLHSSLEQLQRV